MSDDGDKGLDTLLEFVKASRGFDFTGYKRASIERRVRKRINEVGLERYDEYVEYLELHSEEFSEMFNSLLINVTSFFRDPPTWKHMAEEVLPELLTGRDANASLRVWCAGCATGQEPYTVAMVLARVLGDEAFLRRVKIYATDVDEQALETARHATYEPRQIENVPSVALERFFERTNQGYVFRKDLRRRVIFGRNDLVQDAPISRIDLLVCRNTLMYFNAETQSHVLRRFHFALNPDAVLLLGKSEMLITHADLFAPVDLKWRVFRKRVPELAGDRVRVLPSNLDHPEPAGVADNLREAAFDAGEQAHLVFDDDRTLVMINAAARRLFGLALDDLGRPVQDLEMSYRPLELRGHLDSLQREPRAVEIESVHWDGSQDERVFTVRLIPLRVADAVVGTSVIYEDATTATALHAQLTGSKRELEQTYEELQSTVEELETTNEELQSTNEELETTNEELETTNEELQSTNEELETINEELESANEELETINEELRHRTLELDDLNAFLETILTTIGVAVVVLDRDHRVRIWNGHARELWGLTAEEAVEQSWFALDIGLPVDKLESSIRSCLSHDGQHEEVVLEAIGRRGKAFQCRVVCMPLAGSHNGTVNGVIVTMEPLSE